MLLTGKKALITGSSRGIGKEIVSVGIEISVQLISALSVGIEILKEPIIVLLKFKSLFKSLSRSYSIRYEKIYDLIRRITLGYGYGNRFPFLHKVK